MNAPHGYNQMTSPPVNNQRVYNTNPNHYEKKGGDKGGRGVIDVIPELNG